MNKYRSSLLGWLLAYIVSFAFVAFIIDNLIFVFFVLLVVVSSAGVMFSGMMELIAKEKGWK
ncbi:hypothetical protein GOV13_02800 [Candidatus Pacearchaeota archaeon]|nr:hypothetical protein [Candidatus Pacearchaeota archaeon]